AHREHRGEQDERGSDGWSLLVTCYTTWPPSRAGLHVEPRVRRRFAHPPSPSLESCTPARNARPAEKGDPSPSPAGLSRRFCRPYPADNRAELDPITAPPAADASPPGRRVPAGCSPAAAGPPPC